MKQGWQANESGGWQEALAEQIKLEKEHPKMSVWVGLESLL